MGLREHHEHVDIIVPALDEEPAIADVVAGFLRQPIRSITVVDNGSRDRTAELATRAGARVVREPERGYGAACLRGLSALPPDCHIVVFADGDGADHPDRLPELIAPLCQHRADLVVGSRVLGAAEGRAEHGSLTAPQRAGNALATFWLRHRFALPATDLGPFRAIRYPVLMGLGMTDRNYGWTVEMQIKAARAGLRYAEIPVPSRCRVGRSKVSGTVRGVLGAGTKILGLLAYYDATARRQATSGPGRADRDRSEGPQGAASA